MQTASLRVRMTAAIGATALAVLAIALIGAQGADAKAKHKAKADNEVVKGPPGLKFYKPPKKFSKRHGDLIWARKAGGIVPLADARYTKNVLYSSRTPQGQKVAVSGSVSVPKGKPPKGGWPVISWAHGTTGAADVCAPSRNAVGGPAQPYISYMDSDLNEWLRNGYAVLRTDYQGLGTPGPHPYLVGQAEGRGVLDIVTAARELDKSISKRFLIAGHSQGGQSALFAAGNASSWTPKLKLQGTVAFAPASHIFEQKSLLPALTSPSGLTALAVMILHGASTQSSAININALLSDEVLPFYPRMETECLSQLASPSELGGIPPSHIVRSGADTTTVDPVLMAMNPAVKTAAPILIAQGDADTTVFKAFTDSLNSELMGAGNQVTYKVYPGIDHGGVVTAGEADALTFFKAQLPPR